MKKFTVTFQNKNWLNYTFTTVLLETDEQGVKDYVKKLQNEGFVNINIVK